MKQVVFRARTLGTLCLLASVWCRADTCQDWFSRLHLENDKICLLKCESAPIGMDDFMCHDQCETFCKHRPQKCLQNNAWESEVKSGQPNNWPHNQEEPLPWTKDERVKMTEAFSKMPNSYLTNALNGVYKLKRSRFIFSLGAYSTYLDGSIVLYQKAFDGSKDPLRLIIHEYAHHLHQTRLKAEFENYRKAMKWSDVDNSRPGNFIRPEAKDSLEEDFAVNFETYIFEPRELKNTVPNAYQWMSDRLKNNFNLKECGK